MRSELSAIALVAALGFGAAADGATLQGSLRYGGLPVASTFTTMTSGLAAAYETTSQTWTFGTVSISGSGYSISNLSAGTYNVKVRLSTASVGQDVNPNAGDLSAYAASVTVGGTTATQDMDLKYSPHVTQPLDNASTWTGSCTECPVGAEVDKTFTLAWDAVPLADSYQVTIRRWSCSAQLALEVVTPTSRSTQITQQTSSGEQDIYVSVDAYAGSTQLTVQPYVHLTSCSIQANIFHAGEGSQTGRQTHPTNSLFLAQVAHLQGKAPSFWKTDLFLTNPTTSAVTAILRFTPRDVDGTQTYYEREMNLPARSSRTIPDVLGTLFEVTGAGSLEIEPATVEAACRNYTPGAGPGLYGQGFLPIGSDELIWLGGSAQKLGTGGVSKGPYRANLSLTEVWGESAGLTVTVLDRDGTQVGQAFSVSLQPFGTTQINDVVAKAGGPTAIEEAQVVVEVTSGPGRVGAVLSLVDNGSQDPSTLPLCRR